MPADDGYTDDYRISDNALGYWNLAKENDSKQCSKDYLGVIEYRYFLGRGVFVGGGD